MAFTLCLNTSTIRPQPLLDKIRLTGEAGFAAIELWADDLYEFVGQGGEIRDVEKALADYGLSVPSMIAARGWGEAVDVEYPILLGEVKRRLELAARMGSPWLVCSPPRLSCPHDQIARRFKDLLDLGRQCGAMPTFEYISFFESVYQLDQAWQIVQEVNDPDATLIVDAFHSWNSQSDPDLLAAIPASRISHYHIDDASNDLPPRQQLDPDRVMIGEGQIDLLAELRTLQSIGYEGAISLELFNEELWGRDPRQVLDTGLKRLQELVGQLST